MTNRQVSRELIALARDIASGDRTADYGDVKDVVLKALKGGPKTNKQLRGILRRTKKWDGEQTFSKALNDLEKDGDIKQEYRQGERAPRDPLYRMASSRTALTSDGLQDVDMLALHEAADMVDKAKERLSSAVIFIDTFRQGAENAGYEGTREMARLEATIKKVKRLMLATDKTHDEVKRLFADWL